MLELLDRACLVAVEDWKHLGIDADAAALLLASVDTPGESGAAEAAAIAATMTEAGALWAEQSTDDAEAEALFDARRLAYPALERLGPVLTEDICVPRSAVPKCSRDLRDRGQARRTDRHIAHAGDGNLHPLMITPPGDDAARIAAQAAFEEFLDAAIALGGTVTGEHGVGHAQARRHAPRARPRIARTAGRRTARARPAGDLQSGQGLTAAEGRGEQTVEAFTAPQ